MPKQYDENLEYQIHIAKALGWYMQAVNSRSGTKPYTQKKIAEQLNFSESSLSRKIIKPDEADDIIDVSSFKSKSKRPLEFKEAKDICEIMQVSLPDILYFYQHKTFYENYPNAFDKIRELTNKLTLSEHDLEDIEDKKAELISRVPNTIMENSNFITDVTHDEFKPWFGKFYCYFSSTSSDEAGKSREEDFERDGEDPKMQELLDITSGDYIFCGILDVCEDSSYDDGCCHVTFKFLADPHKRIVKRYEGILTISKIRNVVFCELTNNAEGEKTYLIIEKKEVGAAQPCVAHTMAMVLTVSSKEGHRRPCCERMILSRDTIKEGSEEYRALKANLFMNDHTIRITKWGYEQVIKEIEDSEDPAVKEIKEKFPDLRSFANDVVAIDECAFIPESYISKLKNLPTSTKAKFIVMLRLHSTAPWYSKTKAAKADDLMREVKKR